MSTEQLPDDLQMAYEFARADAARTVEAAAN